MTQDVKETGTVKKRFIQTFFLSTFLFFVPYVNAQFNFGPLADQASETRVENELVDEENPEILEQFNFGS